VRDPVRCNPQRISSAICGQQGCGWTIERSPMRWHGSWGKLGFHSSAAGLVYLLAIYRKSEQSNISPADIPERDT